MYSRQYRKYEDPEARELLMPMKTPGQELHDVLLADRQSRQESGEPGCPIVSYHPVAVNKTPEDIWPVVLKYMLLESGMRG